MEGNKRRKEIQKIKRRCSDIKVYESRITLISGY